MARIEQVLGPVRGFAQDYARESMPGGFVWALLDLMPNVVGANLRSRNGWTTYATLPAGVTSINGGGAYTTFSDGRFLVVVGSDFNLYEVSAGSVFNRGAACRMRQNGFAHRLTLVLPNGTGAAAGKLVSHAGTWTIANLPSTAAFGKYGCTYKDRVVLAAPNTNETSVYFSKEGNPTLPWVAESVIGTSLPITGIASLRNSILIFHEAMTERIRGDIPPDPANTDPTGNMLLEPFPTRVGCADARSISYWKDSVIWADERGVHMTDGAATTNLTEKGGMGLPWRSIFDLGVTSICGDCVGDFYIVSLKVQIPAPLNGLVPGAPIIPGQPVASETNITLVCNIPNRTWTRYSNFPVRFFIPTHGADDRERLFAGTDTSAVIDVTGALFPSFLSTSTGMDANGYGFRPLIETPFFPFASGRERVRSIYLSYELDAVPGGSPFMGVELADYLTSEPVSQDYTLLNYTCPQHQGRKRFRVPIRREMEGIAFRFVVNDAFRYFNFYGLEAETWARSKSALSRV
jgi:hypothetical protein